MSYTDLSPEDKLEQAIGFVAMGHPLPDHLVDFLVQEDLYDAIINPGEISGSIQSIPTESDRRAN